MRKITRIVLTLGALSLVGCANDTVEFRDTTSYAQYSPGYTGYTVGYDGYGNYNDGFGPSFWNPRYYFYRGYNEGYR